MAIAVVLAILLSVKMRAAAWYRTAVFMPHVTATVAIALVWMWMFEPRLGVVNTMLGWAGIDGPTWLADPDWALTAVIIVSIWKGIGIKMLIYLAALQAMPEDVYEAAPDRRSLADPAVLLHHAAAAEAGDVLRSGGVDHRLLPGVRPAVRADTDGGPGNSTTVMTYEIYRTAFKEFQMGVACAQSVVLFAFLIVLMVINRRLTGGDEA